MSAVLPALSREYLRVDVEAEGVPLEVLLTLGVSFAFMSTKDARPASGDWKTGDWEPGAATARVLMGPGGAATLTAAQYYAWLRIDGAVERPVRPVGIVKVI